jgi:hypothetical protein
VGAFPAHFVQRALDRVGEHGIAHLAFDRRPTCVARQRRGEYVVMALKRRHAAEVTDAEDLVAFVVAHCPPISAFALGT